MAQLVSAYYMSHASWCYRPGDQWNEVRGDRQHRADVPFDELETNLKKAARIVEGKAKLRARVDATRPDVIIVFGDDQAEGFDFNNFPALSVYAGEDFEGNHSNGEARGSGKGST